ncbi:MAG: hypothetical protein PHC49_10590 [Desulfuromonadaceae bacterium]|nr:hypothetical protein [Desulfuromonadaceae bacterium]
MWTVGFRGIGVRIVTFLVAAGIVAGDKGKVCKPSDNGTVDLCEAEDNFNGVLDCIDLDGRMNAASVQDRGYVEDLPYTGAPNLGWQELVANGAGGVKPPAASVASTLATGVVANNNAITFTAKKAGADGNDISVQLLDPAGNDKALSVDVVGRDIIVSLATGVAGAITSTAAEVRAAVAASAAVDLVTTASTGASTGAAAVVAVAKTDLAGGTDASVGRKLWVVSKDAGAGTLTVDLG